MTSYSHGNIISLCRIWSGDTVRMMVMVVDVYAFNLYWFGIYSDMGESTNIYILHIHIHTHSLTHTLIECLIAENPSILTYMYKYIWIEEKLCGRQEENSPRHIKQWGRSRTITKWCVVCTVWVRSNPNFGRFPYNLVYILSYNYRCALKFYFIWRECAHTHTHAFTVIDIIDIYIYIAYIQYICGTSNNTLNASALYL